MLMNAKKVIKSKLACPYLTMDSLKVLFDTEESLTIVFGNLHPPTMRFSRISGPAVVNAEIVDNESFETAENLWKKLEYTNIVSYDKWSITFSGDFILYATIEGILANTNILHSLQQQLSCDLVDAAVYPIYELAVFLAEHWWDADWRETKIYIESNNKIQHIGKTSIPVPLAYLLQEFDLGGCVGDSGVESLIVALLYSKVPAEKLLTKPLGDFEYGKLLGLLGD